MPAMSPQVINKKKKRGSYAKRWCFTWHEPYDVQELIDKFKLYEMSYIFAEETGEEDETPHLQGFVKSRTKFRPIEKLRLDKRIHWEVAKGSDQDNLEYVSKEHGAKYHSPDLWPLVPLKVITELHPWQENIVKLCNEEPDDRTIHWFWDSRGNIGKTSLAKYLHYYYGAVLLQGQNRHMLATAMRNPSRIYIIAVTRSPEPMEGERRRPGPAVSYQAMESIKDGFYMSGFGTEATGMVARNSPHVFVFANDPPDTCRLSADRWKVTNLGAIASVL